MHHNVYLQGNVLSLEFWREVRTDRNAELYDLQGKRYVGEDEVRNTYVHGPGECPWCGTDSAYIVYNGSDYYTDCLNPECVYMDDTVPDTPNTGHTSLHKWNGMYRTKYNVMVRDD